MVKRVLVGILCCLVVMCAVPAKILAASQSAAAGELIALAASSRFAAPTDEELEIQKMSERRREELREKRRQWQNQASEAAVEEAELERMAEDTDEDKLNLEEIAEENPVTN
jgi:hypothetical protein